MAGIKRFLKVSLDAKIPTDVINLKMVLQLRQMPFSKERISVVLVTTKGLRDQLRIAYQTDPIFLIAKLF